MQYTHFLFLGLSIALCKLDKKGGTDLADVEQALSNVENQSNRRNDEDTIDYIVETIAENFSNKVDDSYDPISWAEKEKDAEKEGIPCCGHIKISSSRKVREMYPFILGDYKQIESKSPQTIYVKPAKKPMFLTQPENTGLVWGYTWGVSLSAEAKWGYIRSGYTSLCPTMAGQWKVFDKDTKRWVVDMTLQVVCSDKLL
jgi:hypothetical protein